MHPDPDPRLGPDRPDPTPTRGDDLAWEAFRYVADLMDRPELEAFEQRLIEDQDAREALADAVDRVGALAIVAREGGIVGRPRWRRPTPALAAAAAVLAAAWWGSAPPPPAAPAPADVEAEAAAVAAIWSGLRAASGPPDGVLPFLPDPGAAEADRPAPDDAAELAEAPAEQPVPSWMVAAVAPAADPAVAPPEDN